MHLSSNPVATKVANDTASFGASKFLDRGSYVTDARPIANRGNPRITAAPGDFDDVARFDGGVSNVAHDERRRGVTVKTVEERRDIDIDDVTVHQHIVTIRDPVADNGIPAGADCRRKTLIAELARPSAATSRIFSHPGIDILSRHTFRDASTHPSQSFSRSATGGAKTRDGAGVVDLDGHVGSSREVRQRSNTVSISCRRARTAEPPWRRVAGLAKRAVLGSPEEAMSLAQIRYFVAVAEEGNVGRAALRLRVAQPPISRQIRGLESELGSPLFARTPRGMQLLPAGAIFLDHARKILAAIEDARTATRDANSAHVPAT